MQAVALICDKKQTFALEQVTTNDPAPDQIAIRTLFSGVSIGTEFALIRNKISWGPYPLCTGYQGTGVVEAVGAEVRDFAVGDVVYFRSNGTMHLVDGTPVSTVQGTHSSMVVTTPKSTHGADHLVDGAPRDSASMFVMPAVGLHGVDMSNPRTGDLVVVHGAGLIGQGVIAACAHRGCVVVAVDIHEKPLAVATLMGADVVINSATHNVEAEIRRLAPEGADVVFECTGVPALVDPAIALCRTHGKFVWQGNYGAAPISMHFLPPHGRQLQMFFPCDDGGQPSRRAAIRNMTSGALPWHHCITHRISFREAPAMFSRIHVGAEPDIMGVVIDWQGA